jgi:hypothetical protein
MSLRMLVSLRLSDLRLATAQQRTTGQNLPSDLYRSTLSLASLKTNDPMTTLFHAQHVFECLVSGKLGQWN